MDFRILIVDDDRFMREMLPGVLSRTAPPGTLAHTEAVGTAEEAQARLATSAAGERLVVLSDYNLKAVKNGLDVLASVRQARPDAVRVLFSGHTREEIHGIEAAQLDGFLEKPFRLQDVSGPFWDIVMRQHGGAAATRPRAPLDDEAQRRTRAAQALPGNEIVPALVRAATKGEGARARALYEEAQRRGQHPEAERETTRALLWQNRVLELVATGAPLVDALGVLATAVEQQVPGMLAAVMLARPHGASLRHGAAPSMPRAFLDAVDGLPIEAGSTPCQRAAREKRTVLLTDVQADTAPSDGHETMRAHGLRASWSTPILSPSGRLCGTFALYGREPREPTDRDLHLLELAANIARVAIESHEAREALRASEARYRSLFNSIDQGFCVIEMIFDEQGAPIDYRFVEVNAAFEAQTGLEQATGRTIRELNPRIEQRWMDLYGKVARTRVPMRAEQHSAALGRWFDVFGFPVSDEAPERVGVLFSDVTQRKLAEAERNALLEREKAAFAETAAARERLRSMIMQAPVGIAILSGPSHVIELANSGFVRTSGRPIDVLLGRSVAEAFADLDSFFVETLDRVYATGEPFVGRALRVPLPRDGLLHDSFLDFVYHPSRDANGAIDGIIVVLHDVTDAVLARQAVEAAAQDRQTLLDREREALAEASSQRARLHDLFMQAPAAIAIVDGPEYVFSFANPRYEALVGRGASDLIGKPVRSALPEVVDQGILAILDRVRDTGEPFRADALPIRLADRDMYLNFVYQPVFDDAGRFASLMAHAVDVTAQVHAQNEARQLAATLEDRVVERTRALQETNRELEAFSYVVSHDLRAPLRAVHHLVSSVVEDVPDMPPGARTDLLAARSSTEDMARLIEALLSLARAAQGELRTGRVDITALARSVLHDLQVAEPERDVDVHIQPELWADGDPRLLRSVLENLVANAWKFSATRRGARIHVGREEEGGPFYVRDNGVGFDMARAGDLFQPFKRLHAAHGFEGTGIGLATVRRIIERHGGRVWVDAQPGAGATFFFVLP